MTSPLSEALEPRCAGCGLPAHRYGRNEGPDRYDPIACINSLRSILAAGSPTQWCTTHNAAWNNHEGACIDWLAGYNPEADCHVSLMLLCTPPEGNPNE